MVGGPKGRVGEDPHGSVRIRIPKLVKARAIRRLGQTNMKSLQETRGRGTCLNAVEVRSVKCVHQVEALYASLCVVVHCACGRTRVPCTGVCALT